MHPHAQVEREGKRAAGGDSQIAVGEGNLKKSKCTCWLMNKSLTCTYCIMVFFFKSRHMKSRAILGLVEKIKANKVP